jgi:hypothetical protein
MGNPSAAATARAGLPSQIKRDTEEKLNAWHGTTAFEGEEGMLGLPRGEELAIRQTE